MTLQDLEELVASLPSDQLKQFRDWFHQFEASRWDEQIERDAHAGRLDLLANAALEEHRAGRTKPL